MKPKSNILDTVRVLAECFVGPDLGQKCLLKVYQQMTLVGSEFMRTIQVNWESRSDRANRGSTLYLNITNWGNTPILKLNIVVFF